MYEGQLEDVPDRWQVVVGNIGTVYNGFSEVDARAFFTDYEETVKLPAGRAAGEVVGLLKNGELLVEFIPVTLARVDVRLRRVEEEVESVPENFVTNEKMEHEFAEYVSRSDLSTELAEYAKEDELEGKFEDFLKNSDFLSKDDMKDYVTEDDLPDAIETVLKDQDLVKDVAAGAAEGAMGTLSKYATLKDLAMGFEELRGHRWSIGERLRFLFTGRLF